MISKTVQKLMKNIETKVTDKNVYLTIENGVYIAEKFIITKNKVTTGKKCYQC